MKEIPLKDTVLDPAGFFRALSLAVCILLLTVFLSRQALNSKLYRQSRILSSIMAQESVDIAGFANNPGKRDTLVKFLGAVTSGYINFELIPISESRTFAAVFQSLNDGITIDSFSYHRRDLSISGSAKDAESYTRFLEGLRNTGHFENVFAHSYISTDDVVRFDIDCAAKVNTAYTPPF